MERGGREKERDRKIDREIERDRKCGRETERWRESEREIERGERERRVEIAKESKRVSPHYYSTFTVQH